MVDECGVLTGAEVPFAVPSLSVGRVMFDSLAAAATDERRLVMEAESGRAVTPGEFLRLSVAIAEGLKDAGLRPGDTVTLAGKNGIDISAAAAAVLFLGATAAPVDPHMKKYEFREVVKMIDPRVVFCDADVADVVLEAVADDVRVVLLSSEAGDLGSATRLEDVMKDADATDFSPADSDDPSRSIAFLACSSGTMGLPKAVMLSDAAMVFQILSWHQVGIRTRMSHLVWLQTSHFFWITGISLFLACTCGLQGRVLVRDVVSGHILKAIHDHKPHLALLAPAHIDAVLHDPDFDSYDLSSLVSLIAGGAALQRATYDALKEKWSTIAHVSQGYGCTEVGGLVTCLRPGQDIASIGEPIPGSRCKVVNVETKELCGAGEEGELCFKSPSLMNGYAKNEEATAEAIDDDGWLHTGDVGYHKDGLIYVSGRIKELIKYMNMQIAPAELEEVIRGVPGVADVGVVGIKMDAYTYLPMALVVKEDGSDVSEEDVVKRVNDNLSEYKQLRGGVCWVESVPRTPTGKIRRRDLQAMAEALYMGDQRPYSL